MAAVPDGILRQSGCFDLVMMVLVAGEQGFEPQLPDPESGVLPLDDSPSGGRQFTTRHISLQTDSAVVRSEKAGPSPCTWRNAAVTVFRASESVVTGVVPPGTGV